MLVLTVRKLTVEVKILFKVLFPPTNEARAATLALFTPVRGLMALANTERLMKFTALSFFSSDVSKGRVYFLVVNDICSPCLLLFINI